MAGKKNGKVVDESLENCFASAVKDLIEYLKMPAAIQTLKTKTVRDIIMVGQKDLPGLTDDLYSDVKKAVAMLLGILGVGQLNREDRLLGSTAVVTLLGRLREEHIAATIDNCFCVFSEPEHLLDLSQAGGGMYLTCYVTEPEEFKLCLCYAIFQCQLYICNSHKQMALDLLEEECNKYSNVTHLAFRTLRMFLTYCYNTHCELEACNSEKVFRVIRCNWENPINGVRKEISQILSIIVDVSCDKKYSVVAQFHLVMKQMSWKMKSKYLSLAALLPKFGVLKALNAYEKLPRHLLLSLKSSYLVSAGSDAYKSILSGLPDSAEWTHHFNQPVLSVLLSNDQTSKSHLLSHWFPPTVVRFPVLLEKFLCLLELHLPSNSDALLPIIALVHLGCKEGLIKSVWTVSLNPNILKTCLSHMNETIRLNAIGAVSHCVKKNILPTLKDFNTVQQFLVENITTDSITLRHGLVKSFSFFLSRIQSSCLKRMKNSLRCKEKNPASLQVVFLFLEWLHKFLLRNLLPGANYQRKITSLQIYLEVLKTFSAESDNKENTQNSDVQEYLKTEKRWHFHSEVSRQVIMECMCDPTSDIQKIALRIIKEYFLPDCKDSGTLAEELLKRGLALFHSPLFYDAECGAYLVMVASELMQKHMTKLIVIKCSDSLSSVNYPIPSSNSTSEEKEQTKNDIIDVEDDLRITGDNSKENLQSCDSLKINTFAIMASARNCKYKVLVSKAMKRRLEKENIVLATLPQYLLFVVKTQWNLVKQNLFQVASSGFSLYGALTTLGHLVPLFSKTFSEELVGLVQEIVNYFLTLFSSQSQEVSVSPSFAEMTQSVQNLLPEKEVNEVDLSPCHQLVLSYLWLSLKACCQLASNIMCDPVTPGDTAAHCFVPVYEVLMKCRHKGAIEAAGSALSSMVRCATNSNEVRTCNKVLLKSISCISLKESVTVLLTDVLNNLADKSSQTSVTRRSAGLAILVHRIVASDAQLNKPLLQLCMKNLLVVASIPLPNEDISEEHDIPQSCALHLICRLVQDSSLHQEMAQYVNGITPIFHQAFSSSLWILRNAAVQLFGALVPLLIGEKKVEDKEETMFGHVTLEEFHRHYPDLMNYLLCSLNSAVQSRTDVHTIPLLALLSKISAFDYFSDTEDYCEYRDTVQACENCISGLLDSDMYVVRKLASKALIRLMMIPVEEMVDYTISQLEQEEDSYENRRHAQLLIIQQAYRYLESESTDPRAFDNYRKRLDGLVPFIHKFSWFSRVILAELIQKVSIPSFEMSASPHSVLKKIISIVMGSERTVNPGIHLWGIRSAQILMQKCANKQLLDLWKIAYDSNWEELSVELSSVIKEKFPSLSRPVKKELCQYFLKSILCVKWSRSCSLLYSLYEILLSSVVLLEAPSQDALEILYKQNRNFEFGLRCWSIMLPLLCALFLKRKKQQFNMKDVMFLRVLARQTFSRTKADFVDTDVRQNNAKAFVSLFRILSESSHPSTSVNEVKLDDIAAMVIDTGIALLQDSESCVRNEAAKFMEEPKNSFVCLQELLHPDCLLTVFSPQEACKYLHLKLLDFSSCEIIADILKQEATKTSPFNHGISNIYAEDTVVLYTVEDSLLSLLMEYSYLRHMIVAQCRSSSEDNLSSVLTLLASFQYVPPKGLPAAAASILQSLLLRLSAQIRISEELSQLSLSEGYMVLHECIVTWQYGEENRSILIPSYVKDILA